MKKLILVFASLLMCLGTVYSSPGFGVKGGLSLANATFDPHENFDTSVRTGVLFGGMIEASLSESNKTTFKGEFLYVEKGWKEEGTVLGIPYEGTATITELDLAPFIVFRFPSEGLTPFIEGGPELGLNLSAKAKAKAAGQTATDDIEDWSSTNFGINLGIGGAIPSGGGEIVLEARYNLGLSNMYTGDGDFTAKTNSIQFSLGYLFTVPTK